MFSRYLFLPLGLLAVVAIPARAAGPSDLVRQLNEAYVGVFDKVSPSVVVIEIEKKADPTAQSPLDLFRPPGNSDQESEPAQAPAELSEGSGIVCRADGYIYTNSHVVDATAKMTVKLKDGRSFPATVVGNDPMSEVAVIKINAKDLPVPEFADSDTVRVGQIACVIGAPYNFTYSFTTGVISGKGRNQNLLDWRWSGLFEDFLQTDASINPGNSGGPLLDLDGRVVGMNTLIQGINKGLGFAISSNMLRKIGEELIVRGKISRPWLGLGIQSIKEFSKPNRKFPGLKGGVIVQSLSDDGPALQSDLRPSDVILKVDGVSINETVDLQREVQKKKIGQSVQLAVWREGREMVIPVKTGEMPTNLNSPNRLGDVTPDSDPDAPDKSDEPPATDSLKDEDTQSQSPGLGLEIQEITPELAAARKIKSKGGLIVTDVETGSEAAAAGLVIGDVITEVNSQPVRDEKSFADAVKKGNPTKGTLLFVEREKGSAFLVLKPGE